MLPVLCYPKNRTACVGSDLFQGGKNDEVVRGNPWQTKKDNQKVHPLFKLKNLWVTCSSLLLRKLATDGNFLIKKTTNRIVLCNPLTVLTKPVIGRDALLISWQMVIR